MIPNKIGIFTRLINKPTTMKYGYYYYAIFDLPFSKENKREIRVWLPSDYEFDNPNKRYKVIYMSDGQNLVDRYLSAFGEWEYDKTMQSLMNEGFAGVIAVGIDCPKTSALERTKELCPPYIPKKAILKHEGYFEPYADKYVDYIINNIKPIIDKTFYTLTDRDNTGIGGSSMGGIMSFYAYMYRPEVFGFALSFSPAFFFYTKKDWTNILDSFEMNPNKNGKVVLYSGGKDFEHLFLKPTIDTYKYLAKRGFDNSQIKLIIDEEQIHHEKAWAKYLPEALKFLLK